jgi:hypothetical protein
MAILSGAVSLLDAVIILGLLALAWMTYRRVLVSSADPNVSFSAGTDTGSTSFLISGVFLIAHVAMGIFVTVVVREWLAGGAMNLTVPAVGLGLIVLGHYIVEKREAGET